MILAELHQRLLTATASQAREVWREAGRLGIKEELRSWLASGTRTAPRDQSDSG